MHLILNVARCKSGCNKQLLVIISDVITDFYYKGLPQHLVLNKIKCLYLHHLS